MSRKEICKSIITFIAKNNVKVVSDIGNNRIKCLICGSCLKKRNYQRHIKSNKHMNAI